jgi:putative acetyltransferase
VVEPAAGAPLVRAEEPGDHAAIRQVHALAFGDDRRVPHLVDALRVAPAPLEPISLVAEVEGQVVGHLLLSAARLDAPRRIVDVLTLSPLGVPLVFLEGSPRYYGARGFERASAASFRSPSLRIPDAAFQVARLPAYESWMTGTLVYSETFWALDCVGLRDPDA